MVMQQLCRSQSLQAMGTPEHGHLAAFTQALEAGISWVDPHTGMQDCTHEIPTYTGGLRGAAPGIGRLRRFP